MRIPFSLAKNALTLGGHAGLVWWGWGVLPQPLVGWCVWSSAAYALLTWVSCLKEFAGHEIGDWIRPVPQGRGWMAIVFLLPYRVYVRMAGPGSVLLFREDLLSEIAPQLYLGGRLLFFQKQYFEAKQIQAVVNLCGEMPETPFIVQRSDVARLDIPLLDNTSPTVTQLKSAVEWVQAHLRSSKNVYIHCAYGHGRSALLMVAVLIQEGRFPRTLEGVDQAERFLRSKRAGVYLKPSQRKLIREWIE